jgi:hypothetical protein
VRAACPTDVEEVTLSLSLFPLGFKGLFHDTAIEAELGLERFRLVERAGETAA